MAEAIERRGHEVLHTDPYAEITKNKLVEYWSWHTGALGTSLLAEQTVRRDVGDGHFDVAFVDNGELISPRTVDFLKSRTSGVSLFLRDNPFVPRDGLRWRTLLAALPRYDLFVTRRTSTAEEATSRGVKSVMHTTLFADEILHQPQAPTAEERAKYGAPVSFVGTWFPERGPFIETLVRRGVPLKVIGHRWSRAANYSTFAHVVVPGYLSPREYSAAVRSSSIAIAMLSKGNADLHTARSLEIPAMGVLFCAERTSEHLAMYKEGAEAVFWSSAEECADICLALLEDPDRIARIAAAGRRRVAASDHWTEPTMERILARTLEAARS